MLLDSKHEMGCFIRYNQREVIYQNEKGVFHVISKHESRYITHTSRSIFRLISKPAVK